MKKLLLSALACVAFVGSGFASNEVVNETTEVNNIKDEACVTCTITILTKDGKGNVLYSETKNYRVCTMTCEQAKEQVGTFLKTGKIVAPSKVETATIASFK